MYVTHPLCDTLMRKLGVEQAPDTGVLMIKIDPYFLYQVGAAIRPLVDVSAALARNDLRGRLWHAEHWLDALLNKSVYRLQTCRTTGNALLSTIKRILAEYEKL